MNDSLWIWGYVAPKLPAPVEFVPCDTHCSLEMAADYMRAPNVIFMNSMHGLHLLNDELFGFVRDRRQVICALTHGEYEKSAADISVFAQGHPNIIGAVLDDFLCETGPSEFMTPDTMRRVSEALKRANPNLKLYVVFYSWQDQALLQPYLPFIDGIIFWVWISTEHYWRYQYEVDMKMLAKHGKSLLQGIFVRNYGEHPFDQVPTSMEMLELQLPRITEHLDQGCIEMYGWLDGCVVLQNGWFSHPAHRRQVQFVKEYFDWYGATHKVRP